MTLTYNLVCTDEHETTGDYPSIAAFEKARDYGFLECSVCIFQHGQGNSKPTQQALSTPGVNSGVSRDKSSTERPRYENVESRFFETGLKIAAGEEPDRPFHGKATAAEAAVLQNMGFDIVKAPTYDA